MSLAWASGLELLTILISFLPQNLCLSHVELTFAFLGTLFLLSMVEYTVIPAHKDEAGRLSIVEAA